MAMDDPYRIINKLEMKLNEGEENTKKLLCANIKMKTAIRKIMMNYSQALENNKNFDNREGFNKILDEKDKKIEELRNEIKNREDCMANQVKEIEKYYLQTLNDKAVEVSRVLQDKDSKIKELQNENQMLLNDVKNCEDYITNQVNEMKKVAHYIDSLVQESENGRNLSGRSSQTEQKENRRQQHEKLHSSKRAAHLQARVNNYKIKLAKVLENNNMLLTEINNEKSLKLQTEILLAQIRGMYDELQAQHKNLNIEYEKLRNSSNMAYIEMRTELLQRFEQEKQPLKEEVQKCNCCIKDQEDQIKSLKEKIENIEQDLRQRENDLKLAISDLENVKDKFQKSEEEFSFEKMCMSTRINALEKQIEDYESNMILKDENNKVLLETIESEKATKRTLEKGFTTITKNNNYLTEMLIKAKRTIKCITEKLEEYDIERGQTQKSHEIKISELQDRLEIADATLIKLRENLDKMKSLMDKNVATRTLSAQLHEAANLQLTELQRANEELSRENQDTSEMYCYLKQVLYEKDKTFENFRNQMISLREHLENEQKLREDTETALADIAAAGDSETAQLRDVINMRNCEIHRLNTTIENLQKNSLAGRLRTKTRRLEQQNTYLRKEIQKFAGYLKVILPGYVDPDELGGLKAKVIQLTDEVDDQKKQIERYKKLRFEAAMELKLKLDEHEEDYQRMRDLIRENAELKRMRYNKKNPQTILLLEKENTRVGIEKKMKTEKGDKEVVSCPQNSTNKVEKCAVRKKDTQDIKIQIQPQKDFGEKLQKQPDIQEVLKLKQQLAQATNQINLLKKQIQPIENRKDDPLNLSIHIEESKEAVKLKEDLKNAVQEIKQLKLKLANAQLPAQNIVSKLEQEKLLKQINDYKKEIADLLNKINKSHTREADLRELEKIKKENTDLKVIIQELESQLENVPSKMNHAENALLKAREDLKNTLELEEARVLELEELPKDDAKTLKTKQDRLEKENLKHIEHRNDFNKPRVDLKLNVSEVEELEKQLKNLREENATLRYKLKKIESGKEEPQGTDHCKETEEKLRRSEYKIKELLTELEHLRMPTVSFKIPEDLNDENGTLGDDAKIVAALKENLLQWQDKYHTDIGKLKEEINELTKYQPGDHENNIRQLEERIEVLENNNYQLEMQVEKLSTSPFEEMKVEDVGPDDVDGQKKKELVEYLNTLEKKNENLKSRIINLEIDNGRLRTELEMLTVDKEVLGYQQAMHQLRSFEKVSNKCQEKYNVLKKRSMKIEIENRNLKKEYINVLIAKEKLLLQREEQTRRLRETNKLLRKSQAKKTSLTDRAVKLQVENDSLKKQLDSVISKELEEHIVKFKNNDEELVVINKALEVENKQLRDLVQRLSANAENNEVVLPDDLKSFLRAPKYEDLRFKMIQLELANEKLKEELAFIKRKDLACTDGDLIEQRMAENLNDLQQMDADQKVHMQAVELRIENDYLKHELSIRDKAIQEHTGEKRINELEDQISKLNETIENLQRVTVEVEIDNEYLRKELERLSKIEEDNQIDHTHNNTKSLEKQNHSLKMKVDHLEGEIRNLTKQMDDLKSARITLEAHTQQKLICEIDKLLNEYETVKDLVFAEKGGQASSNVQQAEEQMVLWKDQYEPELLDLKRDLYRLTGKDKDSTMKLQLQEALRKIQQMELDNHNMRVALEILLKEKKIMENVKLVSEVEEQLRKYGNIESLRKLSMDERQRIKILEDDLTQCKNVNELLRKEQVTLECHMQSQKIKDLEATLKHLQRDNKDSTNDQLPIGRTRSIYDNIDIIKIQQLEDKLYDQDILTSDLQAELQKLRQEKNCSQLDQKTRQKAAQNEIEQLKAEVDRYHKLSEVHMKMITDLEKQLQDERRLSTAMIPEIREKKVSFQRPESVEDIGQLKTEYLKLHQQYEENLNRINDLEEQLRKCQDGNKQLRKQLSLFRPSLESTNEESPTDVETGRASDKKDKKHARTHQGTGGGTELNEKEFEFHEVIDKQEEFKKIDKKLLETQNRMDMLKKDLMRLHEASKATPQASAFAHKKVEIEINRTNNNCFLQNRQRGIGLAGFERLLQESGRFNEMYMITIQILGTDITSEENVLEENKFLKNEVNALIHKLNVYESDNKHLKDKVNRMKQIQNDLTEEIKNHKNETKKLCHYIHCVTSGETSILYEDLENKNKEIDNLQLVIEDLQNQIRLLKLELQGGRGDSNEKHLRKLQQALWKYHDSNEYLKSQIMQLESEKITLIVNLGTYTDFEKDDIEGPTIEEILEDPVTKDIENVFTLRNCTEEIYTDPQETRMDKIEEEISKCRIENQHLKSVTGELGADVICIKRDVANLMNNRNTKISKLVQTSNRKAKSVKCTQVANVKDKEILNSQLKQHRKKWKSLVSKLAQQYQANINYLKRKLPSMPPVVEAATQNPWMVQSPIIQTMPLLLHPMVNYSTPKNLEETTTSAGDGMEQLSEIVDKIKISLDKSKQALQSELFENSEMFEDEEQEEMSFDYEPLLYPHTATASDHGFHEKMAELDRQIIKQHEAKQKVEKLQKDIQDVMKNVKEMSQKPNVKFDIPGPSNATDSQYREWPHRKYLSRNPMNYMQHRNEKIKKPKFPFIRSTLSNPEDGFDSF